MRRRKFESDTASLRLRVLQAGHSTCRHDGTAVILDFRPRIGNRCSHGVHSGHFRAAIPDFRPRLANRCSQKVKTGAIPAAQGWSIVPRPGNAGWAGTSDGVAARGFVNGRGPPRSGGRESTAGAHRSEVPARRQTRPQRQSHPPKADSVAETAPRRQTRPREHSAPGTKKESRLIAESGLSKRGSYLLSHLV